MRIRQLLKRVIFLGLLYSLGFLGLDLVNFVGIGWFLRCFDALGRRLAFARVLYCCRSRLQ
jgi:hypothetical protein